MAGLLSVGSATGSIVRAVKTIASDIINVRTGTVVSDYAEPNQTQVVLDNDPSRIIVVGAGINFPLAKDTRVYCLAYPPRGLIVLGSTGTLPLASIPQPEGPEDSGWITPTLLNGWANTGVGQNPVGYRRIGNQVFLRGFFGGGTLNTTIFVLPAGFRPPFRFNTTLLTQFATTGNASAGTAHTHNINHSTGFLYVDTSGNVFTASGHISNGYQSLDGISFFVD